MGVPGLWDVLKPAASTKSLTQLAVAEGFEPNHGGNRGFRVGIDASIWFFHAQVFKGMQADVGENPELRTLFFRCAKLMGTPLLPLFVFDGPKRPQWKRGKRVSTKKDSWLVTGMQNIINAFGYEWRYAPGEAEAELAYLNRIGVIDAVLTDDVDTFLFGATMIMRNPSSTLSGNRANPIKNSEGRDDGNHVLTFKSEDLLARDDIQLTQGGLILIGLLRGGDYHQAGVPGVGVTIAHGLARCGFGDSLVEAVRTLSGAGLDAFLATWREDMQRELRTNSRGIIGKKHTKLASSFPQDFPDLNVVDAYVNPAVSASSGEVTTIAWRREPNMTDLAKLCELHFEWGYKDAILKRFRTVIWPGAVCRILRRSVLQADDLAAAAETRRPAFAGTPTKQKAVLAQGTPSKMITQYFSRLDINSPIVRSFDDPNATPLITKIHSERRHASTDGLKEYRLEIAPLQLARLAEQGLTGARPVPEVNPYLDDGGDEEEDEDDGDAPGKKKRASKAPPEPKTVLRIWMPACMVELVEPRLVREFEDVQERKRLKKEGKAAPKPRKAKDGAAPPAKTRKPAAGKAKSTKNKYFSDSGSGGESDNEIENIPLAGHSSATAKTTTTMDAPPAPALNATRLFARPANLGASRSSTASTSTSSSSSRSKTAMIAELFAPEPAKQPSRSTSADFFSDDGDAASCTGRNGAKGKAAAAPAKKQPLFLPSSSDEEDVFQSSAPAVRPQKRAEREPRAAGSDSDAVHKSPRKSKHQTSPRAPRRAEPLFLPRGADSDSDGELHKTTRPQPAKPQPQLAPFPMKLPKARSAKPAVEADVIIISSSDGETPPVRVTKPKVKAARAPAHWMDGVIDLT